MSIVIFISIFFISIVAMSVMIYGQVVNNRNTAEFKKVEIAENLTQIRNNFLRYIQEYGHYIIVLLLKKSVKFSLLIKRKQEAIYPRIQKIKHFIMDKHPVHQTEKKDSSISHFLKSVSEYKSKLQRIKEKIKEHEESKLD